MIPFDTEISESKKQGYFDEVCETIREEVQITCRRSSGISNGPASNKIEEKLLLINQQHHSHNHGDGEATVENATANIIKCGIGTGVLFMPTVFKECGIILSIVFQIVTGLVSYYCWSNLCKIIRILEKRGVKYENESRFTIETAAGLIFGDKFKNLSVIITLVFIYGTSVGYAVFIVQTMSQYISNPLVIVLLIFLIYMPISMFKQIEKLGVFSQLGVIALCISIFFILTYSFIKITQNDFSTFEPNLVEYSSLPLYLGVFAFSYDINGVVTEVHASMREKHKFNLVLFRFIAFSCVLGCVIGLFGYLAFQQEVNSVVFRNVNNVGILSTIISCLFSLSLVSSILLYGFPIVRTIDKLTDELTTIKMIITRVLFFISIGLQGVYVQSITNVFNLLGSVFSVILTFVLPIILLEKLKFMDRNGIQVKSKLTNQDSPQDNGNHIAPIANLNDFKQQQQVPSHDQINIEVLPQDRWNTVLNILIVCLGIAGGISGLFSSIIDLLS